MGSRARQLQPVGAHLQALQSVGGDGAPVADMLVDEFSMAGANLLLPKAADAVASLTMTGQDGRFSEGCEVPWPPTTKRRGEPRATVD